MNRYIYARDNPLALVDATGHFGMPPPVRAQSNTAPDPIVSALTSVASAVSNAWNSLPAPVQDGILIAGTVALTVATGGAATPLMLAVGAGVGLGGVGVYAGYTAATGGTITATGALNAFTFGFGIGTGLAGIGSLAAVGEAAVNLSPRGIGGIGERALADEVGGNPQVTFKTSEGFISRMDQYVPKERAGYESKVGYTYLTDFNKAQIAKYGELLKTGQIDSMTYRFYMSPVTGRIGASTSFLRELDVNGISYWPTTEFW